LLGAGRQDSMLFSSWQFARASNGPGGGSSSNNNNDAQPQPATRRNELNNNNNTGGMSKDLARSRAGGLAQSIYGTSVSRPRALWTPCEAHCVHRLASKGPVVVLPLFVCQYQVAAASRFMVITRRAASCGVSIGPSLPECLSRSRDVAHHSARSRPASLAEHDHEGLAIVWRTCNESPAD
jgi:hypothetical protein